MSEVIEEKNVLELLLESLANVEAPLVIFFLMFCILAVMRGVKVLSEDSFILLVMADGLVAAIMKLVKKEE